RPPHPPMAALPITSLGHSASNDHCGIRHANLINQIKQSLGILRSKPHTAMRGAASETPHVLAAMDGMALWCEENGVGHWRIIPFLREVIFLHTERTKSAAWCGVA